MSRVSGYTGLRNLRVFRDRREREQGMSSHNSAPMTPERRAWTEYLRWTQGAAKGDPTQYEEIERRAWTRLQLALMPREPDGPEAGDALDALKALDAGSFPPENGKPKAL